MTVDLVFLWDEAWFAFARFHPVLRSRTAMHCARKLRDLLQDSGLRRGLRGQLARDVENPPTDDISGPPATPDPAARRGYGVFAQSNPPRR